MTRAARIAALLLGLLGAGVCRGATPNDCATLEKHGRNADARNCYQSLTQTSDHYLRAEGYWGLEMYQEANNEFRAALAQSPKNAMYRVRWGRLLHERFNNTDADKLFDEALALDDKNAQAMLGHALVSADGFDSKALMWVGKALETNPKLVEAHELLANLELEDSDPAKAVQEADAAIALSGDALDAMAIHAAVELLADRSPDAWLEKIRKVNPVYGEGYALIAQHMLLNRRYTDSIAYYRKAIQADPRLWSAYSQLGIRLMELGQEQEARKELTMAYDNGYRDAATANSLKLLDSLAKDFVTLKTSDTVLEFNKKEADLLYPYFLDQLRGDIAAYEQKYKMKVPLPVQVEVYPNQEDFAVRTLGMPGLGALGVTFGTVIAMDSPSASAPGTYHWASTLRHEMSHVFILEATDFRVPRWFTEGLATHEETEASPEWGDPITPDVLIALKAKKLLPVAELDRGFIRPEYPEQVVVSYFQAGRICDYIQQRWGADKLLDMVHSFAQRKPTVEAIQQNLGMTPEEFDKEFFAWLYKSVGPTADNFDQWRDAVKNLAGLAKNHQWDEAIPLGEKVRQMYPDYVYPANAYQVLADAYLAKNNQQAAAGVLTDYEKRGGRSPEALELLASLEEKDGKTKDAAETLDRINYIYPVHDEKLHRHLGELWLQLKNYPGAIREYSAVLALNPLDRAGAQYDLAQAYFDAGQRDKANEHVLASLEIAPGFRPAQKLLLQLNAPEKGN